MPVVWRDVQGAARLPETEGVSEVCATALSDGAAGRVIVTAPYLLAAHDDADDDGGTLYVLYEERDGSLLPLKSASWPQPLEAWAASVGRIVRRVHRISADTLQWPDD